MARRHHQGNNWKDMPGITDTGVQMTWPELRDYAKLNGLTTNLRYFQKGKRLKIWLSDLGHTFVCHTTQGHKYGIEFLNVYKPSLLKNVNAVGMPILATQDVPSGADSVRVSLQYKIPAVTTAIYDKSLRKYQGSDGYFYLTGGELKCRTVASEGSSVSFTIVDRDDVLGAFAAYGLTRDRLSGLTLMGTFAAGDTVTGGTSGAVGTVMAVGADYLEIQHDYTGTWSAGETISNGPGQTATLGSYVEGGVFAPFKPFVEDEWLEDKEEVKIDPGGSKPVPGGLYLRFTFYNADVSSQLRIKVVLEGGRMP